MSNYNVLRFLINSIHAKVEFVKIKIILRGIKKSALATGRWLLL